MAVRNLLLTIEYDGTDFCGWQRQPSQRTVQGEVERVLSILCAQPVSISGTSRTDAGVHAYGQRASFSGDFSIPTERIKDAANNMLSGSGHFRGVGAIRIREVREVPPEFHARFDSVGKTYIYKLRTGGEADPFSRYYCYQLRGEPDLGAMRQAAAHFVGTHDFRSLMAAGGKEMEDTVRTIYGLSVFEEPSADRAPSGSWSLSGSREIHLAVTGNGFLYNMVRILTGTLVEIGLGRRRPEDVPEILDSLDRRNAGHTAPPQGLYLKEIYYEQERMLSQAAAFKNQEENTTC